MKTNSYTWTTDSIIRETDDSITIVFNTNGGTFSYEAGQFVNLALNIEGEQVTRSYSLSSSPASGEQPAITVKKAEGGKMSQYIFDHAEMIREWRIDGPYGSFFDYETIGNKPIVLIGGGSGVTPLYSILKTVLRESTTNVFLINCNRTAGDVLFSDGLKYLESIYPDRFSVLHFLSRTEKNSAPPFNNCKTEKLSRLHLKKFLKNWLGEKIFEAQFFLCGPSSLIKMSIEALESLDLKSSQIHIEYFVPPATKASIELPQTMKEVLFYFYEQTNLLEVAPGRTILEAALNDRIPLSYSCKQGTCGRCVAKRTSGSVYLKQNFALSEQVVEEGYLLLCQAYPLDDEVIITID